MSDKPRAYTVVQVAELLQVADKQVYELIRTGSLAAVRIGKHYRIPDHALERLLRSADVA